MQCWKLEEMVLAKIASNNKIYQKYVPLFPFNW
jgi:hypothetical protein